MQYQDSLESVKVLIKEVLVKVQNSLGKNKAAWKAFLKECQSWLTKERLRISKFISDARTALSMDGENIIEMLGQYGANKGIAEAIISSNFEAWKIFAKSRQKKNPALKTRYRTVGEYYVTYKLSTKVISKYMRQFVKQFQEPYGAKFSISTDRDSINIYFTQLKASCKHLSESIAEIVRTEANKFNYIDSDSGTDYYSRNFHLSVQKGLYDVKLT